MSLRRFVRVLRHLSAALLAALCTPLHAANADDAVLGAHAAFRDGDATRLARHAAQARGHVLEPWVAYWQLAHRIESASPEALHGFLSRHAGSYLAEKLRTDWLLDLARRRDWTRFDVELAPVVLDNLELRCSAWASRLAKEDRSIVAPALRLWLEPIRLPEACDRLADDLAAAGAISEELAWRRARVQFENRRRGEANRALAYLPERQRPSDALVREAANNPETLLVRLLRNGLQRTEREVAVLAATRLAGSDVRRAAEILETRLAAALPETDRRYLWARVATEAARRHEPEALEWFARAGDHALGAEEHAWRARAALRAGDWSALREAIDAMPHEMHRDPAWTYWYARALGALGNQEGMRAYLTRIAGQPDFYGLLALEELGDVAALPTRTHRASRDEVARAAKEPGLARALALFRLGLRTEATREWVFTIRLMNDRELLAAAELALAHEIFDRAINTADRTQELHNFGLRYLAPFREVFSEYARSQGLDEDWVLGLVRQESRFIVDARSVAGARGLMQLMPRTAKWMAGKMGMRGFQLHKVTDVETNVTLGTGYLKLVLDDLGHPVLASAGYNAGPGRAKRWRETRPLEAAAYIETIPFDETRDYVKKVMSNAVFYALVAGRTSTLRARLGVIPAKPRD